MTFHWDVLLRLQAELKGGYTTDAHHPPIHLDASQREWFHHPTPEASLLIPKPCSHEQAVRSEKPRASSKIGVAHQAYAMFPLSMGRLKSPRWQPLLQPVFACDLKRTWPQT